MQDIYPKKVIVTGVTGQDGSYMVDFLLEKYPNYFIYGVVRRSSKPDYSNLKKALENEHLRLIVGDLSDSQSVDNLIRDIQPDYFINFAGQSFVGSSWDIPEQTFDVNAMGVLRCLEAIRKRAPQCRFYNAGSSEQWGNIDYSPQDEKHPFKPRSPYGASKSAAHYIVKVYRESYNLYAIQGLLLNHESERRGEEFVTRKISKGVAGLYKKEFKPICLGNIDAKRDWSYAPDFIEGVWMMLNQEIYREDLKNLSILKIIPLLKEYVLSSGKTHSIREFIDLAFKEAGIVGKWRGEGLNENFCANGIFFRDEESILVKIDEKFYRPADVNTLHGDSSLARKELGWMPKTSFAELVKIMVKNDIEEAKNAN